MTLVMILLLFQVPAEPRPGASLEALHPQTMAFPLLLSRAVSPMQIRTFSAYLCQANTASCSELWPGLVVHTVLLTAQ